MEKIHVGLLPIPTLHSSSKHLNEKKLIGINIVDFYCFLRTRSSGAEFLLTILFLSGIMN